MLNVTIVGPADEALPALLAEAGARTQSVATGGLEALMRASPAPDVIAIDTRHAEIPGALRTLKRQRPQLAVLAISKSLDSDFLLEAMRNGVSEVVAEPLTSGDLERALVRLSGQHSTPQPGTAFGFVGAKGGVGTTTIAVNVATALAGGSHPERTLLMDLHQAGGDTPLFFGVEPRFSAADAIANLSRLDSTFFRGLVVPVGDYIDLLPAPDRLLSEPVETEAVRHLIDFTVGAYRYVVLDLPRSSAQVLDSLASLNTIVVVANQELPTIRNAARLVAMLRQRYGRDKIRVLLSRTDRRAEIGDEDIERAIGAPIDLQLPSAYRAATHALHAGRPVVLEHHDLADAFRKLALALTGSRERPASKHEGLFSRLTHTVTGI